MAPSAAPPPQKQIELERKCLLGPGDYERLCERAERSGGATGSGSKILHDAYFDVPGTFDLTLRDYWLRSRNGQWELKRPVVRVPAVRGNPGHTEYEEVVGEAAIGEVLREEQLVPPGASHGAAGCLSLGGTYSEFAALRSERESFVMRRGGAGGGDTDDREKESFVVNRGGAGGGDTDGGEKDTLFDNVSIDVDVVRGGSSGGEDQAFGREEAWIYRICEVETCLPASASEEEMQQGHAKIGAVMRELGFDGLQKGESKLTVFLREFRPEHFKALVEKRAKM